MIRSSLLALVALLGLAAGCSTEPPPDADTSQAALSDVDCAPLPRTWLKTWRIPADNGQVQLRVGEARPAQGPIIGDILFFHGFSDRLDNHRPLFEEWTSRGFRVVSFEYPSHGETCGRSLTHYLYPSLARFAADVEQITREDVQRPLFLAGWSMGGLLATRILQGMETLSRPVKGAMLIAPGIDVRVFLGRVKTETLTRNDDPPHTGPIAPDRPALFPIGANILWHADRAKAEPLPSGVPVLTIVGGDKEDVYANSAGVRDWALDKRKEGALMTGFACSGGYHELDNEPAPMGPRVRAELGSFAEQVAKGSTEPVASSSSEGSCTLFTPPF